MGNHILLRISRTSMFLFRKYWILLLISSGSISIATVNAGEAGVISDFECKGHDVQGSGAAVGSNRGEEHEVAST